MISISKARRAFLTAGLILASAAAWAQAAPFDGGWTLDPTGSSLSFLSIKDGTKVESSSFASLEGAIDETGAATIVVHLESVDTKIDLRNVRMRFLFFETYLHPQATITAQIDPALLNDLPQIKRKTIPLPYVLDLHGVKRDFEAEVVVTLLDDDQVYVSTVRPISVSVADFAMGDGLKKLEEAAGLPIIPSATVTFDFKFSRSGSAIPAQQVAQAEPSSESRALESTGDFAPEECRNRFLTLSEANEIYFASGSSRLQSESGPMLDSLAEIIGRCPGLVVDVGGHTDSVGPETANLRLSERRAASVASYLVEKGIAEDRFRTSGYGETQPIADNETDRGRWRNRRIAFTIVQE